MKRDDEINEIIATLNKNKKFRDVNFNKISNFFKNIELNFDEKEKDNKSSLNIILKKVNEKDNKTPSLNKIIGKILKWTAAPAFALILFIIFYFTIGINFNTAGKANFVHGDVEVRRKSEVFNLAAGDEIYKDDVITTNGSSYADINFNDNVFLRISSQSETRIDESYITNNKTSFNISITSGELILYVKKMLSIDYVNIFTPNSVASVRGTLFGVKVDKSKKVRYEVYEGKVQVKNSIDMENLNINPEMYNKINAHFDKNSVILGENEFCNVKMHTLNINTIENESFENIIKKVDKLKKKIANNELILIDKVVDFVEKPEILSSQNKMVPFEVSVRPGNAIITIDGKIRKRINGKVFLTKGNHQFSISSPGYESRNFEMELNDNTRNLYFSLEENKSEENNSKVSQKSKYLLYDHSQNYLIMIYNTGRIVATESGKVIWQKKLNQAIYLKPALYNKNIILFNVQNEIVVLSSRNGSQLWKKKISGFVSKKNFTIDDDRIFISANQMLQCYSIKGKLLWKTQFGGRITSSPLITKNLVYVPLENGPLTGVDRYNGFKIIKINIDGNVRLMRNVGNYLFILNDRDDLYCYNINTDEIVWFRDFVDSKIANLINDRTSLYVCTTDGVVIKLDFKGNFIWKINTGSKFVITPRIDEKNIYISSYKTLFVINKTQGKISWSIELTGILSDNFVVSKQNMYFVSKDKGLIELKK